MGNYTDVLEREATWFKDPSPDSLPGARPLIGGTDGPFDELAPYVRRINQKQHQLFLYRTRTDERRADDSHKAHDHSVVAIILWAQTNSARDQASAARLDDAVARVLERIRGLPHDHTHGGRFFSAGERGGISVDYPDPRTVLAVADGALSAGQAHEVTVAYTITEYFVG